jgi:ubiquitin conjugation factor E4 B
MRTLHRKKIITSDEVRRFDKALLLIAQYHAELGDDEDAFGDDIPDEFLDPLMSTMMEDPVQLPSGTCLDRATIKRHLRNSHTDPFSRQPLKLEDCKPAVELRAKIRAWRAAMIKAHRAAKQAEKKKKKTNNSATPSSESKMDTSSSSSSSSSSPPSAAAPTPAAAVTAASAMDTTADNDNNNNNNTNNNIGGDNDGSDKST